MGFPSRPFRARELKEMAFNNIGTPQWLAPNASIYWEVYWNGDGGTEFVTPDLKTPGSTVTTADFGKRLETNGNATYTVVFTNQGPNWAYHNVQGGGVV